MEQRPGPASASGLLLAEEQGGWAAGVVAPRGGARRSAAGGACVWIFFSWTTLNPPSGFRVDSIAFWSHFPSTMCRDSQSSFLTCDLFNSLRNLTGVWGNW